MILWLHEVPFPEREGTLTTKEIEAEIIFFQSMWIIENWKVCEESPTVVRRKFMVAFNRRHDQLPKGWAFKREYLRIKKTRSADHLVAGKKGLSGQV